MTFYLGTAGADLLGNEQSLLPASAVEVTVTVDTVSRKQKNKIKNLKSRYTHFSLII